jgi:hypothetical protein
VILLSSTRPEGISALLVLPVGARILAHFPDDGSTRDLTLQAANLITEYLLRGGAGEESGDGSGVEVARLELAGGELALVRMALIDLRGDVVEEIPAERLLPLLSGAISMAITDAVHAAEPPAAATGDTTGATTGATTGGTQGTESEPLSGPA